MLCFFRFRYACIYVVIFTRALVYTGAFGYRYPLFIKTKPVLAADGHPVVFQLYKSTMVFLTAWILLIPRAIRGAEPV